MSTDIRKGNFKNDIRKTLVAHALFPVLAIIVLFLLLVFLFWNYSIVRENRQCNETMTEYFDMLIGAYSDKCLEFSQGPLPRYVEDDPRYLANLSAELYETVNSLPVHADFFVLDEGMKPLLSSNETKPQFLKGKPGELLGLKRRMARDPGQTFLEFSSVSSSLSGTVQMEIGRAILVRGQVEGYLVFVMNSDDFLRSISNLPCQTVVADQYDHVFVANNYQFHTLNNKVQAPLLGDESQFSYQKDRFYVTRSMLNSGLQIFTLTSVTALYSMFFFVSAVLVLIFVMMTLSIFISAKRIAVSKTRIVDELVDAFNCVEQGNLNMRLHISTGDEFEIIGESYNMMLDSIKELIRQNNEKTRENMVAEIKQLESQFNPHFLFNTLEIIRVLVKLDPEGANRMIINLSTLLRYSIKGASTEVTVREDIAYTRSYLEILKARFNERLTYSVRIQPEAEECIIPKLIFQPIIENSIKYGFDERSELSVMVTARFLDSDLIIVIYDNGVGIERQKLQEINDMLRHSHNSTNYVGLFNVHRRVKLMYGDEYGVEVLSDEGEGTAVRIRLPIYKRGMLASGEETSC